VAPIQDARYNSGSSSYTTMAHWLPGSSRPTVKVIEQWAAHVQEFRKFIGQYAGHGNTLVSNLWDLDVSSTLLTDAISEEQEYRSSLCARWDSGKFTFGKMPSICSHTRPEWILEDSKLINEQIDSVKDRVFHLVYRLNELIGEVDGTTAELEEYLHSRHIWHREAPTPRVMAGDLTTLLTEFEFIQELHDSRQGWNKTKEAPATWAKRMILETMQ